MQKQLKNLLVLVQGDIEDENWNSYLPSDLNDSFYYDNDEDEEGGGQDYIEDIDNSDMKYTEYDDHVGYDYDDYQGDAGMIASAGHLNAGDEAEDHDHKHEHEHSEEEGWVDVTNKKNIERAV